MSNYKPCPRSWGDGYVAGYRQAILDALAACRKAETLGHAIESIESMFPLGERDEPPQPAEPDLVKCAECGAEMIQVRPGKWQHPECSQSHWATEPEKKKPYAQGSALGEFGVIPMCDQVDDETACSNRPEVDIQLWR